MSSFKAALREFSTFGNKPLKYEPLQCCDSDASSSLRPVAYRASTRQRAGYFTAGLLSAALVFILSLLAIQISSPSPYTAAEREAEDWNYCGRSSAVAKERGCVMEPLFYGWMPPQCSWNDFSDQWPVFEDRTWYSDKNMTVPISPEDLWAGKHVHIYTSRYHGEHCLFQWRKLQYAVDQRKEFLDNKTISVHHTSHCADQMSQSCEGENSRNDVELGFYRCRKTIW